MLSSLSLSWFNITSYINILCKYSLFRVIQNLFNFIQSLYLYWKFDWGSFFFTKLCIAYHYSHGSHNSQWFSFHFSLKLRDAALRCKFAFIFHRALGNVWRNACACSRGLILPGIKILITLGLITLGSNLCAT